MGNRRSGSVTDLSLSPLRHRPEISARRSPRNDLGQIRVFAAPLGRRILRDRGGSGSHLHPALTRMTAPTYIPPMPDQRDTRDVLRLMPWFFAGMVIFAFVAALTQADSWAAWGLILTWAFASTVSGGAIGFLFGVPKIIQSDKTDATQGTSVSVPSSDMNRATSLQGTYRQQVNTNLTEISDWLTKIIVGLGLIKLARLPSYLSDTAGALAAGIGGTPAARALAMGIIVSFSIGGFLLGYLTTRLFLAEALSHADQLALGLQDVRQQVASTQVQVNSIESRQSVLRESVFDAQADSGTTIRSLGPRTGEDLDAGDRAPKAAEEEHLLATLQTMAEDYLRIQSPDWAERGQLKDQPAAEMAKF